MNQAPPMKLRTTLIPPGAVALSLAGAGMVPIKSGRWVELPDAIQALRDIAAGDEPKAAARARQGLGGLA